MHCVFGIRHAGTPTRRRAANAMEKSSSTVIPRLRFLMVVSAVFWVLALCLRLTVLTSVRVVPPASSAPGWEHETAGAGSEDDPCRGRYVYIHDLPSRFNEDILRGCGDAGGRWPDMCGDVSNGGLGRPLDGAAALTGANGWYATHQFALDAIFHARMRRYRCLTNDSSAAAAVFVPFYAGFDYALHRGGGDGNAARDAGSLDLARWLVRRPEWRRAGGRDHFLVAGRAAWDFRRGTDLDPSRGTNLLLLPAIRNMTVLVVESSNHGSTAGNDVAVPYPTSFHPRTDADVLRWQRRIRRSRRRWLMSFVGSPRPADDPLSVRSQVIVQCAASPACRHLRCSAAGMSSSQQQCRHPRNITALFRRSTFCLQPPGDSDSYTRRSAFDAMVAGCIPVFFHGASAARQQYRWHLPGDVAAYSVLVPEDDVRAGGGGGNASVEAALRRIPRAEVERMREEVVRLVPRLVYADPRGRLDTARDAFDVALEGVLAKVAEERKELGAASARRRRQWRLGW